MAPKDIESREAWEKEAKNYYPERDGWVCIDGSKGFPDLIHYNTKTGDVVFIELKAGNHRFHAFQKQMLKLLVKGRNRKAYIVYYDHETKKITSIDDALKAEHDSNWEGVKDIGILD